jgi:pimeloyl-ACP methyl ester carboxylesterase
MIRMIRDLIFPGAAIPVPEDLVRSQLLTVERLTTVSTPVGEDIAVVMRPPSEGGGWAIFLYGNAMTLADTADIRVALAEQGIGSVCVDYPGFGLSAGVPSEKACRRAADIALGVLWDEYGIEDTEVTAIGWSLGSAVALDLAARRPVGGLVLLSPLTSIAGVALNMLGIRWSGAGLFGPFNAAKRAADVACDVLLIAGQDDTLCPPSMAGELAGRLDRASVQVVTMPGTGHNDLLSRGTELWAPIGAFVHRKARA